MTLVAQMMPGMQWIPLIALFVGVTILVALIIVGYRLIRKFFPNSKLDLVRWFASQSDRFWLFDSFCPRQYRSPV